MVSGDLTSGYLMVIYRDVYDTDTTSSIAVIENSLFQQFCVQEHFPDAEIITCKSRQECVDAVESGKAKCTLMSSDTYYAYRNEFDNLSDLNLSNTGYEVPVSLVTRRDDVQMYSFLKKGLASIKDQDIHEALIVNGYANPEMNVRQFLQKHVILVLLVLAVVIAEKISGREEAEEMVHKIKDMIMRFNGLRGEFQINYACGYALSEDYPETSLADLLNVLLVRRVVVDFFEFLQSFFVQSGRNR